MVAAPQLIRLATRTALTLAFCGFAPGQAQAQVGHSSGVAQVVLVARAPVQGSIQGVLSQPAVGLPGGAREGAITLRMSANSGYRLIVRGLAGSEGMRVWFRSARGRMEEVATGAAVVVVDDLHPTGIADRRVEYRVEGGVGAPDLLPVRYELQISPTL